MLLKYILPFLAAFLYPPTPEIPVTDTYHGYTIVDSYRWLEEESDAVKQWDEEQQALSEAALAASGNPLPIYHRLKELMALSKNSTFTIGSEGKMLTIFQDPQDEQPIYYIQDRVDAPLIELLNPNKWGEGYTIDNAVFSPNGKTLAYTVTLCGDENGSIKLLDLETRQEIEEPLQGWRQKECVWRLDSKGFYYISHPKKGEVAPGEEYYWPTVYFHLLGTPCSEDRAVFHDPDDRNWQLFLVPEEEEVLLHCFRWDNDGEEEKIGYYIDLKKRHPQLKKAYKHSSKKAKTRHVQIGGRSYFITNSRAPNFKIMAANSAGFLRTLIKETDALIVDLCGVGGVLAVTYLKDAHTKISLYTTQGKYLYNIPLPEHGIATLSSNWEESDTHLMFSSLTTPPTSYTYNVHTNTLELHHDQYDKEHNFSHFESELIFLTSKDGTPFTMYVAHKKGISLDGNNPVLLHGYGGFGASLFPSFKPFWIPWLEAGGVIAMPNIRGGGEYGESWHRMGKRACKQNSFDDFIAAAEWLIDNGYTCPEKLGIEGSSNGGLVVGACVTQRPGLFRAALCQIPLLDMLRYHHFKMAGLWTGEYGCSEDPEAFHTLYDYSPYHRVQEGVAYPAVLFYGGKYDMRSDLCHIRKMCAKLQQANASNHPILQYIDPHAGHIFPSEEQFWRYMAKNHGFLMDQLGMRALPPESATHPSLHLLNGDTPLKRVEQRRKNKQQSIQSAEKQGIWRRLLQKHAFQYRSPSAI